VPHSTVRLLRVYSQVRKFAAFVLGKSFSIESCRDPNGFEPRNRSVKPYRADGGNFRHYSVPGCSLPMRDDTARVSRVRLTPADEGAPRGSYGFVFLGIIESGEGRCKIGQPLSTCDCLLPYRRGIASFCQHENISTRHLTICRRLAEMAKHRAEHFREFSRRGADLAT
jgi:hypothetical protein